jgi:hypothetical protein
MKLKLSVALAAVCALPSLLDLGTAPASADIIVTYTGTIAPMIWNGSRYVVGPTIDKLASSGLQAQA